MVVLVLIATTYTSAMQSLSGLVFKICQDWYQTMPSTDKNSERKNDLELKHISDELIDCSNKMQLFFVAKIESNFKLIA